jgi:hypothetical protein
MIDETKRNGTLGQIRWRSRKADRPSNDGREKSARMISGKNSESCVRKLCAPSDVATMRLELYSRRPQLSLDQFGVVVIVFEDEDSMHFHYLTVSPEVLFKISQ